MTPLAPEPDVDEYDDALPTGMSLPPERRWGHLPLPTGLVWILERTALRGLLEGLPSLAALGTAIWLGWALVADAPQDEPLVERYRAAAARALAAAARAPSDGDRERHLRTARLCQQRLRGLAPGDTQVQLALARSQDQLGQTAAAVRLMSALAPVHGRGHDGPLGELAAHEWLATRLRSMAPSPARTRALVGHLRAIVRHRPDHPWAREQLAAFMANQGDYASAARHLEQAVLSDPARNLELARVLARWAVDVRSIEQSAAMRARARASARLAETALLKRLATDPGPDPGGLRLRAAEARVLLRDHAGAVALIEELPTSDARRAAALSRVWAGWADAAAIAGRADDAVDRYLTALGHAPRNPTLLPRLVALAARPGPIADAIIAGLAERGALLDRGQLSAALGSIALLHGKRGEARPLLERALALGSASPALLNNLAWCLLTAEPPELPRALTLVERALAADPRDPRKRGTRGEILLQLGRHREALPDLIAALPTAIDAARIHRLLGSAYEALKMPREAESHRRAAGERDRE